MSHANPTTSSSPDFQLIFNNALEAYRTRTKKDLITHPLLGRLENCNSPSDIVSLINQQVSGLHQSQRDHERLTRWLDPTVRVLYAFSGTLRAGVSLVCIGKWTRLKSIHSYPFPRRSLPRVSSLQESVFFSQWVSFVLLCGPL